MLPLSERPPLFAPKDPASRESETPPRWAPIEPEPDEGRTTNLHDYDPLENR